MPKVSGAIDAPKIKKLAPLGDTDLPDSTPGLSSQSNQSSDQELTNSKSTDVDPSSLHGVVEEPAVETLIAEKQLGARLKALRLKRSMGLVELGQLTSLSPSFLSQLETGRVVPTLRNLARIAMVHKVDIAYFFHIPRRVLFKTSRAKDRISISIGAKDRPFMFSQSMSALIPDKRMVPCIAELLPGFDSAAFEARLTDGLEFSYVMQGSCCLTTSQRSELLEQGDAVWIDGSAKRQYKCAGDISAMILIISFPRAG